jgi:V-type H+-transporting ATPase subunit G
VQRFGNSKEEEELERKTEDEIRRIYEDYERNKQSVIEMLIERIIHVDLEIPLVVKGNFGTAK